MSVIVYSKTNCPACLKAKALLDRLGVEYEVVMIDRDMDAMDFIASERHKTVPQLYKDGKLAIQGGYVGMEKLTDEELYNKLK